MNRQLKLKTMAAATMLALGLPLGAYAATGVHFDPDGGGAAGTTIISAFTWDSGHVLYSNCFGNGGLGATSGCTISAQGTIASVPGLGPIPAGVSYTFTLVKKAIGTALSGYNSTSDVGGKVGFADLVTDPGAFTIYVDKTGVLVNDFLGTGYDNTNTNPTTNAPGATGEAKAILKGTVKISPDFDVTSGGSAETLDQSPGGNLWGGLQTLGTSGTPKFNIEVTSVNADYFKDPIAGFFLTFSPDATGRDNSGTPFDSIHPAVSVAGTAFDGKALNGPNSVGTDGFDDIFCGDKATTTMCSGEFQGQAKTTFLTQIVPEPGMLALLGVGLAGLGTFSRRRKA